MAVLKFENVQKIGVLNLEKVQRDFVKLFKTAIYLVILEKVQFLAFFNLKMCKNCYLCTKN